MGGRRSITLQNEKNGNGLISHNSILRNKEELYGLMKKVTHLKDYPLLMKVKQSKVANPYYVLQKLYEFWDKPYDLKKLKCRLTVGMLFFMGLRESEFIQLKPESFVFSKRSVSVKTIKQRRAQEDLLPLDHVPESELEIWEKCINRIPKLFDVDRRSIYHRVSSFFGEKINPHALRHSLGLFLYETTKDIKLVQEILRHKNIAHTSIYTEVSKEEIRRKLRKIVEG